MMNRIIILSVFACFIIYDLITWTPHKTKMKPVQLSSELYDPKTGVFSLTGEMKVKRADHKVLLLNNGKLLVIGGVNGLNNEDAILSSVEFYDPITGVITPVRDRMKNLSGL